jgi:hypothetical protein
MNYNAEIPGLKVEVYENRLLPKNYTLALKEQSQVIVGDYYTFIFKTFNFNQAVDLCIDIAKQRVEKYIEQRTKHPSCCGRCDGHNDECGPENYIQ